MRAFAHLLPYPLPHCPLPMGGGRTPSLIPAHPRTPPPFAALIRYTVRFRYAKSAMFASSRRKRLRTKAFALPFSGCRSLRSPIAFSAYANAFLYPRTPRAIALAIARANCLRSRTGRRVRNSPSRPLHRSCIFACRGCLRLSATDCFSVQRKTARKSAIQHHRCRGDATWFRLASHGAACLGLVAAGIRSFAV